MINFKIIAIVKFGDWGLGIGDWPNPQSPIPNPQICYYSLYSINLLNINN